MRLGGKGDEMDPPGRQAAAAVTKQGKSGGRLPLLFPPPPLDPLSPTQLGKLGAVRHTASLHWMPVCDYAASGCQWRVQSASRRVESTRQSKEQWRRSQPHSPKHSCRDVLDTAVHAAEKPEKLLGGRGTDWGLSEV